MDPARNGGSDGRHFGLDTTATGNVARIGFRVVPGMRRAGVVVTAKQSRGHRDRSHDPAIGVDRTAPTPDGIQATCCHSAHVIGEGVAAV